MTEGSLGGGRGAQRTKTSAPGKRTGMCKRSAECLQKLNMEGSRRKRLETVDAEAADMGLSSTRHVKELKLHPSGELQPPQSQPDQHIFYMKKNEANNQLTGSLFDKCGIRTRNICLTLQVFFLPGV